MHITIQDHQLSDYRWDQATKQRNTLTCCVWFI